MGDIQNSLGAFLFKRSGHTGFRPIRKMLILVKLLNLMEESPFKMIVDIVTRVRHPNGFDGNPTNVPSPTQFQACTATLLSLEVPRLYLQLQ